MLSEYDLGFKFAGKFENRPIILLLHTKEKLMFTCRERTEALAWVLIAIILNNSNLYVHSKLPIAEI